MVYFPVDDDMAFHPKVMDAGNEAIGMWTRAGALCKKHTTGGFVPVKTARALGSKKLADKLVAAGLWVVVEGGYQFHDWTKQAGNADAATERERVEQSRVRNAERQKEWRERNRKSNAVTNGSVTSGPSPSPSPMTITHLPESSPVVTARETTDSNLSTLLLGQQGITSPAAVIDAVWKHTRRRIDSSGVYRLTMHLVEKAKTRPTVPQRYVIGAVSRSPFEVQKWLDENAIGEVA